MSCWAHAGIGNREHIYEFGKNLGIAFQVQDDYLDCFGDPAKFGKQVGGDILANKKTFLMIHAMEVATDFQKRELADLMSEAASIDKDEKIQKVLAIFRDCKVDEWAKELKEKYLQTALQHLEDTAVRSTRKQPLTGLAGYLIQRES